MPTLKLLTVVREMRCSDRPGLDHVATLERGVGVHPTQTTWTEMGREADAQRKIRVLRSKKKGEQRPGRENPVSTAPAAWPDFLPWEMTNFAHSSRLSSDVTSFLIH